MATLLIFGTGLPAVTPTVWAINPSDYPQGLAGADGQGSTPRDDVLVDRDRHDPSTDSDAKTRHLNLFLSILHEQKLDTDRRQEAAMALLEMGDPQAVQMLIEELRNNDTTTRRLIAGAVVRLPQPPPAQLAPVLIDVLLGSEPGYADELAKALGRYTDDAVIDKLVSYATDTNQDTNLRQAAIVGLGNHHTPQTAGTLIGLVEPGAEELPKILRDAVYEALETSTGIWTFGHNPHRWSKWWQSHQALDDRAWFAVISHNFTLARSRLVDENRQVLARFVDTQRQLYRTTAQSDRPAMLIQMLEDPMPGLRELAIDLCVQRMIDNRPIGPVVKAALVPRLDDPSVAVRRRATQLLHDLADEQSAVVIGQRIFDQADQDPELLRTQLRLIARWPQALAVPRALRLLEQPELAEDAAGFLAAAAQADQLDEFQSAKAAAFLNKRLKENPAAAKPQYITLLARIGTANDWELIQGWLDNEDESLKRAAAAAWADSDQPLGPLLDHRADPSIQEIVVTAARQRGDTPQTLTALLAHQPQPEQAAQAWERAVLAVAERVSATAVLEADATMAEQDAPLDFRDKILTIAIDRHSAIEPTNNGESPQNGSLAKNQTDHTDSFILSQLLLARAEVRLAAQDPVRALDDYARVKQIGAQLSPRLLDAYRFGALDAYLATDAMDDAFQMAEQIIRDASGSSGSEKSIGRVVDLFVKAVQRNLDAQQLGQTQMVLAQLRELLGNSLTDILNQRLAELEQNSLPMSPSDIDDQGPETAPTQDAGSNKTSLATPRHPWFHALPLGQNPNQGTC